MKKPISVAMATYNGEKYLIQQLDSVFEQTVLPNEIIIVDDCSTDNSWNLLQEYASSHTGIKLSRNPQNLGACQTFAQAISLCGSEYIVLADQDDVWLPNKLELLLKNIGDNMLIHSDAYLVDESLQIMTDTFKKGVMSQRNFTDYLFANNVTGCTCLFRRELVDNFWPIPAGFYIHDHYLALCASYSGTIKYLPQPLIYYRQHAQNQIGENSRVNFDKFINARAIVGNSLKFLINHPAFKKYSCQVDLVADYHLSVSTGHWQSKQHILNLWRLKKGIKYLCSFYILTGFGVQRLAKLLYTVLKK